MNDLEFLREVRNKIARERDWTQYSFARDMAADPVEPQSWRASCWCLAGAALACRPAGWDTNSPETLAVLLGFTGTGPFDLPEAEMADWNDEGSRLHREVLERLDTAIARLS